MTGYGAARHTFTFAAIVWVVALWSATATLAQGQASVVGDLATTLIYAIASVICHQRPERSFHWRGAAMPVCARCLGIYVGAALVAVWRIRGDGSTLQLTGMAPARLRLLCLVGAVPSLLTLAWEWGLGEAPSNLVRALSGVPLGAAVALVVFSALEAAPRRPSVEVH